MAAPLFSKICTQRQRAPSSSYWAIQVSMTPLMAASGSSGSVLPWSGEKQMTRPVPRTLSLAKRGIVPMVGRRVGQQGREVVGEDVGAGVGRVGLAAHTGVAGAQVAVRVVCGAGGVVGGFLLALPGAFGPVGRDENPAVLQRVVATMGVIGKVEHGQHPVPNGFTTRPMVRLCIAAGGAQDEQS